MPWSPKDAGALILLAALVCAHVWPVALAPATASFDYNYDGRFHVWLINWVAHQALRAPLHLGDANMFHPLDDSLAYADATLVPGLVVAPVRLVSDNPYLAHNVAWLLGFALTAAASYWLGRILLQDRLAALGMAVTFTFNAHVATRYPHVMATWMVWLPLACVALERIRTDERWRWPLLLGLSVAGAGATSGYYGVIAAVLVAALWSTRIPEMLASPARFAARAVAAVAVAAAVAVPVLGPWLASGGEHPVRSFATPASYLATTSLAHWWWAEPVFVAAEAHPFFPGVAAILLAALGLVRGYRAGGRRRVTVAGYAAIVGVGVVLSLDTPAFDLLRGVFPPASGMRAVQRMGLIAALGVAVLAGHGVAALRSRLPRGAGRLAALAAVLLFSVELYVPPRVVPAEPIARLYERVDRLPADTVLLEYPFHGPGSEFHLGAEYLRSSMVHWRPLVNGYGSNFPERHERTRRRLRRFPSNRSLRELDRLGVTAVIVHTAALRPARSRRILRQISDHRRFRFVRRDDTGRHLFRYKPRQRAQRSATRR